MADQNLTQMTQLTEAQTLASILLYAVLDQSGSPADAKVTLGGLLTEYYKIAPSVSSNNLTLKITHLDGTDPSSTNPLIFKVGDTWQLITSNLSFTKNAGTNWCSSGSTAFAAKDVDYFVYIIQETGASAGTKLGFSRIPYAKTMVDFNSTSTNEKYIAGGYTNFNNTDTVRNIGRFKAQLSATASFNWSIPTAKVVNYSIFETDWLVWQPAGTASGSMTYTITATDKAEYRLNGNGCEYEVKVVGTTGGSASNTINLSPPFTATNASHNMPRAAYVTDPSTVLTGHVSIGSVLAFNKYDNSNFGTGAGRYVASGGGYRIG